MRPSRAMGPIALALLLGCGPKSPPASPAVSISATSHPIRAAQGGIAGDATGAQVTLPPGALPKDATLQVAKKPPESHTSPGVRVVGAVWNFQVDGAEHFTFSKPVTISVPFDPALSTAGTAVGLSVWSGERWEKVLGSHLDPSTSRIVARVNHFSEYAPTQDQSADPVERAQEDLYLKNEYWYCRIIVSIHGEGSRSDKYAGQEHYSISREAEVHCRVKAVAGELAFDSVVEEMRKRGVTLPPQATQSMESARGMRHWATEMAKPQPEDRTQIHIEVKDSHSSSSPKLELGELREDAGSAQDTLEGTWDGPVSTGHGLEIDVRKGTYSFSLGHLSGGLLKYHHSQTGSPNENSERPTGLSVQIKNQKLPGKGGILSGSLPIPKTLLAYTILGIQGSWDYGYGHVRGRLSWTFSPTPLDDVELVMAPQGYEDWLPRGGTKPGEEGNSLPIQVRLQRRGGGSTKVRMTSLFVHLKEVSNEPGVCLNVPLKGGDDSFDLKWKEDKGFTVEEKGTAVRKKGSEFDQVDLHLICYDWGAWGTVVAQCVLTDGRILWATLDKDRSEEELRVPKREPDSKIADKWKKEMNAVGLPDTDDQETQTGNANNGDGLTVYEEYRGMMAKGKHTRDYPAGPDGYRPLSPRRKDIIVCNTIRGEPAVIAGFHLLEKAAGIHVVEVDETELPDSRQVNVNLSPTMSIAPQRGLKLYDVELAKGTTGLTPKDLHQPAGSRAQYDRVQVDLKQIRKFYRESVKVSWTVDFEISQTVAHELAHGLDLDHHGGDTTVTLQNPARLHIYDPLRRPMTLSQVPGKVGEPDNDASGDVRCIMCYNDLYTWSYQRPSLLFATTITAPGSIFCTSRDGTGHNADFEIDDPDNPGHPLKIHGVFGKAVAGPCLPMMRIKDPK